MHIGSWGTPDFGLTELLGSLLNKPRTENLGSNLIGPYPTTTGLTTYTDQGGVPRYVSTPTPNVNTNATSLNLNGTGGGTGGGSGVQIPTGGGDPGVDLAKQAYEQRINAIRNLFGQTKQRAADIRSEADRTFADLLKQVGAFRDRSKGLFDTAGQEITNNASEILGSNARTAREQEGTLRAQGRALGLGDSSKFRQQTGLAGRLAAAQGDTLATRGEQNRANQNLFQERQDQAQAQEDEATRYKQNVYDQARAIENIGLDQFGDNVDAASNAFGTSLNNILNYQRQLASINPLQANSISAYTPDFSNVKDAISQIIGTPLSSGSGSGISFDLGSANPVQPTSILDLLKRSKGLIASA